MSAVIEARGVARWYGQVMGVNDLSAEIPPGICALLGPNGAGKSTLIRLITGQLRPFRGEIRVLGVKPFANRTFYRRLGYCPDADAHYGDMTGRDFVTYALRLSGFGGRAARERSAAAIARVGLEGAAGRRIAGYSKGMRQRVKLAQAIAHDPSLLVLDEPMSGLDPVARHQMMQLLRELAASGVDILISSHILHEVESLTDRILLIHRGRILAQGTVPEIRALLHRHPRKVELQVRDGRALAAALMRADDVVATRLDGDAQHLTVETRDIDAFHRRLPELVARIRPGIRRLTSLDANLEAVFDYLVG